MTIDNDSEIAELRAHIDSMLEVVSTGRGRIRANLMSQLQRMTTDVRPEMLTDIELAALQFVAPPLRRAKRIVVRAVDERGQAGGQVIAAEVGISGCETGLAAVVSTPAGWLGRCNSGIRRVMRHRRFEAENHTKLIEGAVWEHTRRRHEPAVKIVKCVHSRIGDRYLVEGIESGRRWLVNGATLLDSYTPQRRAS